MSTAPKTPITQAPWSYLIPVEDMESVDFYIFERENGTDTITPAEIEAIVTSLPEEWAPGKVDLDELSAAGSLGLIDLPGFAETYDAERYRENELYLQEQCVDAILALPALCDALEQFKFALPQLTSAYHADQDADTFYKLLATAENQAILSLLATARKSMVLPKLPLDIETFPVGDGDWEFTVNQTYGTTSLVVFYSAACYAEQHSLLLGFLLYDAFSTLLPKTLLRFEDKVDGPVLFNSLQDCADAFLAADTRYEQLIKVMDASEDGGEEE